MYSVAKTKIAKSVMGFYFYLWSALQTQEMQCTNRTKKDLLEWKSVSSVYQ